MSATPRLTALAVALIAPAVALAEPACKAEKYTTVCRSGERELRIIRNTVSPSGRYGVAWEAPDDGSVEEWIQNGVTDGSKLAGDFDGSRKAGGAVKNFLVRLPDGRPIRQLAGDHFGDHPFYNHREVVVTWSSDSRYVAILNQAKWTTDVSDVYFVADISASKPVGLVSICKRVTKAEVAKRRRKGDDGYSARVDVSSVGNDGTVAAKCDMEQGKKDYFHMGIRLKVTPQGNGLKTQLMSARLCSEDDERGSCADPPARD